MPSQHGSKQSCVIVLLLTRRCGRGKSQGPRPRGPNVRIRGSSSITDSMSIQLRSERSQPYCGPSQEICRAFKTCERCAVDVSVVALDIAFDDVSCLETSLSRRLEPLIAQGKEEMIFESVGMKSRDRITI